MKTIIKVEGMGCENCIRHVTEALEGLSGIQDVRVDLQTGEVTFENPQSVGMDIISSTIEEAGYQMAK